MMICLALTTLGFDTERQLCTKLGLTSFLELNAGVPQVLHMTVNVVVLDLRLMSELDYLMICFISKSFLIIRPASKKLGRRARLRERFDLDNQIES